MQILWVAEEPNSSTHLSKLMSRLQIWVFILLFAIAVFGSMSYLHVTGMIEPNSEEQKTLATASDTRLELPSNESSELPGSLGHPDQENGRLVATLASSNTNALEIRNEEAEFVEDLLIRGDQYLTAGNYGLALENYYAFEKTHAKDQSAILLRQALCCEFQGHYKLANRKYRSVISNAQNSNHQLLAIAGFARCLTERENYFEALGVLTEQTLKIDGKDAVPEETRAQLLYQYAKVLEIYAIELATLFQSPNDGTASQSNQPVFSSKGKIKDLTEPFAVATESLLPNVERFLAAVDFPVTANNPQNQNRDGITINLLQRPSSSTNVISVSVSGRLQPVSALLGQLTATAGLELLVSPKARSIITGRSRTLNLKSVSLSSVLDQLVVSFDLVWFQEGEQIHLFSKDEFEPGSGVTPQFRFDSANRAFRRLEIDFSEDERRNSCLLSRANLSLLRGDYDRAANQYQELDQVKPTGELQAKMFFNLGKLNMLLKRVDEANRFFYLAVDQTLDSDLESSSYCLLSSNHLSAGNLDGAVKTGRRGLTTAVSVEQVQLATLNLARAYLMLNDPFSANTMLFRNSDYFENPQARAIASVLGAYARSIGVTDENGLRTERIRLLTGVSAIKNEDYLSFADCYIAALSLEQLGFREEAAMKLLAALAKPDVGSWQRKILLELGMLQRRMGQIDQASQTLEALISEEDEWTTPALRQLAQLYTETGQSDRCIRICKQLWEADLEETQKSFTLQVLGTAYQNKGEHHTAALCFAGVLPHKF